MCTFMELVTVGLLLFLYCTCRNYFVKYVRVFTMYMYNNTKMEVHVSGCDQIFYCVIHMHKYTHALSADHYVKEFYMCTIFIHVYHFVFIVEQLDKEALEKENEHLRTELGMI